MEKCRQCRQNVDFHHGSFYSELMLAIFTYPNIHLTQLEYLRSSEVTKLTQYNLIYGKVKPNTPVN